MKFPKQAKHSWSEENFSTSSFRGRFGVAKYTDRLDSQERDEKTGSKN